MSCARIGFAGRVLALVTSPRRLVVSFLEADFAIRSSFCKHFLRVLEIYKNYAFLECPYLKMFVNVDNLFAKLLTTFEMFLQMLAIVDKLDYQIWQQKKPKHGQSLAAYGTITLPRFLI